MAKPKPKPRSKRAPKRDPRALELTVLVPVYNERHYVEASLRRVLALDGPLIAGLQVVVVDDCSTDGSWDVIERLANEDSRLEAHRHELNRGKGGALRTALEFSRGEVTVVHDADLEYDPADIPRLLVPFVEEGADAVYGSRYMAAPYRRTLMHRHTLMNQSLTFLANCLTDLNLSDLETCYKAVRTQLLKSIPLRSDDFRIEVELTFKLAKRRARIFEVPIRYLPRSYEEGKKIRARDGALALWAMTRFTLVDDIYRSDEVGHHMLTAIDRTRRFVDWLGGVVRPHVGDRVLEVGAGIGTLTNQLIPRHHYVLCETDPSFLGFLRSYAIGKPYIEVRTLDAGASDEDAAWAELAGDFDTAIALHVLERTPNPDLALARLHAALRPGGRLIAVVPQNPWLQGPLDEALEHRERYTREGLKDSLEDAGFELLELEDFNRASVPFWWANSRLGRRTISRIQLKAFDTLLPLLRRVDERLPWSGQSLVAVAQKR